ncbi:chorismate-binding protein [Luteipulveratus flavus]|uniref:Chorismate-binding protein n=1 Tax=Luteipulveratus flavus TaxID=3031728 RepID=A0ABT6C5J4_9MICO|nr:chorismate-binding protein [Luteipulveratus sp. YIM 133296]MDF8263991.1 chorismate-binding protein [Luteipulveratus sp. YIM 133296]
MSDRNDAVATFGDRHAEGVLEVSHDPRSLDAGGFWVVVLTFEGELTAIRMRLATSAARTKTPPPAVEVSNEALEAWSTSLDRHAYEAGVREIRARIAAGEVYQVNLCRVLSQELPEHADLDLLAAVLRQGNPAPYAARIHVPTAGLDLVCASPELFLSRTGDRIVSAPIKGTAPTVEEMLDKDYAENVMITDLVRNDLSPVVRPGTVAVDGLCVPEVHPGLTHLVSTVTGRLRPDVSWADILAATFPPGSVSGAPKSTALQAIRDLEPVPRGPYCGAVGWIDADRNEAALAVGIRTFWSERESGRRVLRFGTGAGITWGSDPAGEWWETVLKARRLVSLAASITTRTDAGVRP